MIIGEAVPVYVYLYCGFRLVMLNVKLVLMEQMQHCCLPTSLWLVQCQES